VVLSVDFDGTGNEVGQGWDPAGIRSAGGYSARKGIPRMLEIFRKHDVPATFFVPGFDAETSPDIVKTVVADGHEVAAHGYKHERFLVPPDEEEDLLRLSHRILTEVAGSEPRGWRSPGGMKSDRTVKVQRALGYIYDSSDKDFDRPYPAIVDGKPSEEMIELPNNTSSLDDAPLYIDGALTPAEVLDLWKAEFDTLYHDTGYYMLTYHPRSGFGSGTPSRAKVIDRLISYIKGYPDVEFIRLVDLAEWCLDPANGFMDTTVRIGARA
jgi:peptidoglycan-N-acetylglucosamine deacetylase